MKNSAIAFLLLLSAIVSVRAASSDSIKTHIDLRILNRPNTKAVLLLESGSDPRFGIKHKADAVDGVCTIDYSSEFPKEMEIIFSDELERGSFTIKRFYAEGDTVRGIIDGNMSDYEGCFKSTGRLQQLKDSLQNAMDVASGQSLASMFRRSDELDLLNDTAAIAAHIKEIEVVLHLQDSIRCDYLLRSEPSLFGLMTMKNQFAIESAAKTPEEVMEKLERKFAQEYSSFVNHPYYDECRVKFITRCFKPGREYNADYKIRTVDGQVVNMAELIKGRPAIIDLWASWCIPCRINSKALMPVYEKYAPRGLAYVAVAREHGNTKAMAKAMESDGYPWQSYVDLDDADGVWERNGCGTSGGRILLIAADGTIVAINPSPSTVEKYLEEVLPEI